MDDSGQTYPLVYCVVINLNGRALLLETLDSVRAMTYPNFRVVVTDNGSTDGSQDAVRTGYSWVELLENGKNLGFGGGNNVGIQYALDRGADWVILLNNDIVVHPEMLSEMMKVAVTDLSIGIVSPKIFYFSPADVLWFAGGTVNFWTGAIAHRGLRQKDTGDWDRVEDTEYITGCAMLMRRAMIEQVGMFDPAYFPAYAEDADLSERTRRAGFRLVYAPAAKLWHKVSSFTGGGNSPAKTALKIEHNLIFFRRYAAWYQWLTIPFCIGFMALVYIVKELLKGNFGVFTSLAGGFRKALSRLFS